MGFSGGVHVPTDSSGAVPTSWQDQHSEPIIVPLHIEVNAGNLIAAPTVIDASTVALTAGHSALVGHVICIQEGTSIYWATILNFDGGANIPTVDGPLDRVFTTAAEVCIGETDLGQVASLAAPVIAHLGPIAGVKWDVTRIHVSLYDDGVMDSGKFGTEPGLTNGLVLRQVNGHSKNIGNVKTNGDMTFLASDHDYDSKAPAGFASLSADLVFGGPSHVGSVIRLDGDAGDVLHAIIQDDLSDVLSVRVMAIAHVVTN